MLPASLKTVYQQYKADTDTVASWLANTAKGNGYGSATKSGATGAKNPPAKSGRLKGKARKEAKAAAAGTAPPTTFGETIGPNPKPSAGPKKRYVLPIRDFEPMAAYVANLESVIVPDYFAVAIERVIWGMLSQVCVNGGSIYVGVYIRSQEAHLSLPL